MEAVLFDLDGTILDSIESYYKLADIMFARLDLPPISRKALVEAVKDGDFNWDVVLPVSMLRHKEDIVTKAAKIVRDVYPELFGDNLRLIRGARKTLKDISAAGLKMGIVTASPAQSMLIKIKILERDGIDKYFDSILNEGDHPERKPAAGPLLECARRIGAAPNASVYVGDTRVDIKAGKAAGMMTVGVLTGFDDRAALQAEKPDAIIESIADLKSSSVIDLRAGN